MKPIAAFVLAASLLACSRGEHETIPATWLEFAWRERTLLLVVTLFIVLAICERIDRGAK